MSHTATLLSGCRSGHGSARALGVCRAVACPQVEVGLQSELTPGRWMTSKFMPTAASRGHLSQLMGALPQRRQGWSRHTGAGLTSELIPGTHSRRGQGQCQQQCVLWRACTQVTGNATGHTSSRETTPAEEHTAAPFQWSTPVPPTSRHSLQLGLGLLLQQLGTRPCP